MLKPWLSKPLCRLGPLPRSFAADAFDCIMVLILMDQPNTRLWRNEAGQAGREIKRIVVAYEAGRDGFWLARWLRERDIEVYVIHPTSIAVSREHRRTKTDRLDTNQIKAIFARFGIRSVRVTLRARPRKNSKASALRKELRCRRTRARNCADISRACAWCASRPDLRPECEPANVRMQTVGPDHQIEPALATMLE